MKKHSARQKTSTAQRRQAVVVASPDCRIQFANPEARRWLKEFFGRPAGRGHLPRKVCQWLAVAAAAPHATSLIARHDGTQLFIRRQNPHVQHTIGLLIEKNRGTTSHSLREERGLTRREIDVLYWLAAGKANSEIGQILGIASGTVRKHLERIYEKLGVENRTAAASFSLPKPR